MTFRLHYKRRLFLSTCVMKCVSHWLVGHTVYYNATRWCRKVGYSLKSRTTFATLNQGDSSSRMRTMRPVAMTGYCVINYVTAITCALSQLTHALWLTSPDLDIMVLFGRARKVQRFQTGWFGVWFDVDGTSMSSLRVRVTSLITARPSLLAIPASVLHTTASPTCCSLPTVISEPFNDSVFTTMSHVSLSDPDDIGV